MARRVAWAAIKGNILNSQQAGALPKRSAVDLAVALTHDIKNAPSKKKVATLVIMDIQGAFNAVL